MMSLAPPIQYPVTITTIYDLLCAVRMAQEPQGWRRALGGVGVSHCMYRTKTGDRCAVGCLIPEDRYKPDMEGLGVGDRHLNAAGVHPSLLPLMSCLQSAHDGEIFSDKVRDASQWRDRFEDLVFEVISEGDI